MEEGGFGAHATKEIELWKMGIEVGHCSRNL